MGESDLDLALAALRRRAVEGVGLAKDEEGFDFESGRIDLAFPFPLAFGASLIGELRSVPESPLILGFLILLM